MDEKLLRNLLRRKKEDDCLDFKAKLKLYQEDGKLVDQQRDELIKDILGLANGNSHTIRKKKYLIIGADDSAFDENGFRVLHNVDYKVPSRSDIAKWLTSASSPTVPGIDCELVTFIGCNLFIIAIPPTFDLHETTRDLTASKNFHKHTVFARHDQHIEPASVQEGITIQRLKHLYRQEIANPSGAKLGLFVGGVVAFLIGGAKIESASFEASEYNVFLHIIFVILGILFGGGIGWFWERLNELRYDWRYLNWKQQILILLALLVFLMSFYLIRR